MCCCGRLTPNCPTSWHTRRETSRRLGFTPSSHSLSRSRRDKTRKRRGGGGAGEGTAPAGEDEEAEEDEPEEANNRKRGIKKNRHTRVKTDSRLALLALWFGEAPFSSITVLDRLTTLLTVCKNAETDADADADVEAATDVNSMVGQDDGNDGDDEDYPLFSFAHVYEEIVKSANLTNPDQGGEDANFDPCRVVLCLSPHRRTKYLIHLHPTRLRPVVKRFQCLTTPSGMSPVLRLCMRSRGSFLISQFPLGKTEQFC